MGWIHPLETERLLLQPKTIEDDQVPICQSAALDLGWIGWGNYPQRVSISNCVDNLLKKYREGFHTYWGIIPKELGIVIGIIGLIRLDWELRSAEVGFVLGKRFQGVGFMTEACRAVLSFGFEEMRLEWIEAKCRPVNKASERLLTNIGMQRVGNLCTLYPKRDREELVLYSIPQAAWNQKR